MKGFPSRTAAILVVADDVRAMRNLQRCSEKNAYGVLAAASGEEGFAKATESRPDTVVLDLALPDMHAMPVLEPLSKQSHNPILIVSECRHGSEKISALDSGANDFIVKTFRVGEPLARLRVA